MTTEQEARTANKGFAIAGVPCFADTFVQGGSSVLRMKFSAKTPRTIANPKNVVCKLTQRPIPLTKIEIFSQ